MATRKESRPRSASKRSGVPASRPPSSHPQDQPENLTPDKKQLRQTADNLEQLVQQRTLKLLRNVEEMKCFSAIMAHDLRAPLRSINGFSEILRTECTCQDPTRQGYIQRIWRAAEKLDKLLTAALGYAKILQEEISLGPIDPKGLLVGIIESHPQFQSPKAELIVQDLPLLLGNEAALTQCFSNLLDNAVKFVPEGTTPRIRVWAETSGEYVRLWFEDNGLGIPQQSQKIIWGIFQKLNLDTEGTGMGLAVVQKLVERMNGQVGVVSEPGQGSRFWVELKACAECKRDPAQQMLAGV